MYHIWKFHIKGLPTQHCHRASCLAVAFEISGCSKTYA